MKIELKNIKHTEFASHETHCFEATVYIDGQKRATVSNDGQGGPDNWSDWKVKEEVEAYAKTLPPAELDSIDPKTGKPYVIGMCAEILIGSLVNDHLLRKDFKRLQKKFATQLVWLDADGKIYAGKKRSPQEMQQLLARADLPKLIDKNGSVKAVLNTLPEEKAYAIFLESVTPKKSAPEAETPPKSLKP